MNLLVTIRNATLATLVLLAVGAGSAQATGTPAAEYYTPQALKAMGERYEAAARFSLGRPAASFYTPRALKAMGERYEAAARFYLDRPAASYYTPQALRAMNERWAAMARAYTTRNLGGPAGSSFDWSPAVIGAGGALALLGLAGAWFAVSRLRRARRLAAS